MLTMKKVTQWKLIATNPGTILVQNDKVLV